VAEDAKITGDHAYQGGAVYVNDGTLVVNGEISGNSTDYQGGMVYSKAGSVTVTGGKFDSNKVESADTDAQSSAIYYDGYSSGTVIQ